MTRPAARTDKIDLRASARDKQMLQSAAKVVGARSVSDFVLTSALDRAAEVLPDRQRFGLDADQWEAFQAALDASPRPLPRLKTLLSEPSRFETPST